MAILLIALLLVAMGHAQFVAYTLTYTSTDCSGTAGSFTANNQTSCTATPCSAFGGGSKQSLCYQGTLQSLANPIVCQGCAYCGFVDYVTGSNCAPDSWITTTVERLGVCVNSGDASSISYGCAFTGTVTNFTQYTDSACKTPAGRTLTPSGQLCVAGPPQCQTQFPVQQVVCSYTNLFNPPNALASSIAGSLLGLAALLLLVV